MPARPSGFDPPLSGARFSLSPWERAGVRGKQRSKHQRACELPTNTTTKAPCAQGAQRRDTRTIQRVQFAPERRAILPLPKGEGQGEGETTLETPTRLAAYAGPSSSVSGNLFLGSPGPWLVEPVGSCWQNSSGRFGWRRLVPPHPDPLPWGEGTRYPTRRRVEALWIGESAADDSLPKGEGGAIPGLLA